MNWILRDVRMILPEGEVEGDAWIKEGRWAALGRVPDRAAGQTFLARGAYLLPGLIDTHVHFREPGLSHKGTFFTESRAALAGGVTTTLDMPNTAPPITSVARWEEKMRLLQGRSWTHYGCYVGATSDNLAELRRLDPRRVPGVKVFLASSTGDLLVTEEAVVRRILQESPVRVLFHSESEALIQAARQRWESCTWDDVPDLHARARPSEACIESTRWLLSVAREFSTPLHILHVTTQEEVALLRGRPSHVSAETCPVYLTWSAADFPTYRNFLKCNPSLKYETDREALWQGLADGTLEVVGTDHAPHLWQEKEQPYPLAPSGVPSHGYLLPWLWTIGQARHLPLRFWVEKACHAPARLWRLRERGPLREGYWADGVLFDPEGQTIVPPHLDPRHFSKCRWHPLAGRVLQGQVLAVWVNGSLSYHKGAFYGAPAGQAVEMD
ncbi:MAG: dihydroorotase [Bacteroidia bacterium]|nr:MAG: dihydroorotase [Bacteroidia bacterium]